MADNNLTPDRPNSGILLMLLGVALFAVMDAIIKWLTADFPISQIVALRSWFGLPVLLIFALNQGGLSSIKFNSIWPHLIRFVLVLVMSFGFFWVLSEMKLVDAIAITFAAPIFSAVLSILVLKESVGKHRWMAILLGFIGILVMLRPGVGVFQWASVVALATTLVYSILMITTRYFRTTESASALTFYPQFGMCIIGIVFMPFIWVTPTMTELMWFAIAGVLGSTGIVCITMAFRLGPVSTIAPFEYTALIWASILGYVIWTEFPDGYTLIGAGIVILSGGYILYRETILSKQSVRRSGNVR